MEGEYYKTKESVNEYIKLAKDANGSQLIEKLKNILPLSSTLLELGSGPGSDWKILNTFYKTTGSDNSNEFLNYLITENPAGEFFNLDAVTLKTDKTFDGIYSNKMMHHLRDNELKRSIENQHHILNKNGIICHSFGKEKGLEVFKGLFVNYHSKQDLKNFYQDYFEILSIEDYMEFEEGDSLLLIAKKNSALNPKDTNAVKMSYKNRYQKEVFISSFNKN